MIHSFTDNSVAYHTAGKFVGGKVWQIWQIVQWFTKLKLSKLVLTINNLLVDVIIHQTFFHQMLKKSQFAKLLLLPNFSTIRYISILSNSQLTSIIDNNSNNVPIDELCHLSWYTIQYSNLFNGQQWYILESTYEAINDTRMRRRWSLHRE